MSDAPFGRGLSPMLEGAYAPVFDEIVRSDLRVVGEIPRDLNGVYLRNGPNPRYAPLGRYHWFDGDGMLHAAHFEDGRVTYRNRWIRTDGFEAETAAGRSLYHGVMESHRHSSDRPMKDTANTDVIGHAGVAVASWYLAGRPCLVDPITLETVTATGYAPGRRGGFSAHAKVDEHSGELMFFDYGTEPPYMTYGVIDRAGALVHHVPIALPGPRLPHDMAVTEHYTILHDLPLFHDEDALKVGRHKLAFHPNVPARFGIVPRRGAPETIRWFEAEPCFVYHVVNAWEDGDEVVMVGCRYVTPTSGGAVDATRMARMIAALQMDARLYRWRFDLRTGRTCEETIEPEHNVEFPTVHAGRTGHRTRWAYLMAQTRDVPHFTGITRHDTDTGTFDSFTDGPGVFYSEAPFAPRDGAVDEDDGYLVSFVWDANAARSQLQIFDARRVPEGPLARVSLPQRVPVGFHAAWLPATQISPR